MIRLLSISLLLVVACTGGDDDGSEASGGALAGDSEITSKTLDALLGTYEMTKCDRAVPDTLTNDSICDFATAIDISKGSAGSPKSDVLFVTLKTRTSRVRSEALFASNPGLVDAKPPPKTTFLVASGTWAREGAVLAWRGVDEVFTKASWTFALDKETLVLTYEGEAFAQFKDRRHVKDVMTLKRARAQ